MVVSKGYALSQHVTLLTSYLWMICCEGTIRIVEKFKNILELSCKLTSMIINRDKSTISMWGITTQE